VAYTGQRDEDLQDRLTFVTLQLQPSMLSRAVSGHSSRSPTSPVVGGLSWNARLAQQRELNAKARQRDWRNLKRWADGELKSLEPQSAAPRRRPQSAPAGGRSQSVSPTADLTAGPHAEELSSLSMSTPATSSDWSLLRAQRRLGKKSSALKIHKRQCGSVYLADLMTNHNVAVRVQAASPPRGRCWQSPRAEPPGAKDFVDTSSMRLRQLQKRLEPDPEPQELVPMSDHLLSFKDAFAGIRAVTNDARRARGSVVPSAA